MVSPEGSKDFLEELEKEIHSINSLASIIRSVRSQVDLSKILDCQAYDATVRAYLHLCLLIILVHAKLEINNNSQLFPFQHAAHLESLLEESRALSTQDLHDSGIRTLCICEQQKVDLEKVFL